MYSPKDSLVDPFSDYSNIIALRTPKNWKLSLTYFWKPSINVIRVIQTNALQKKKDHSEISEVL